jgi:hypothetical protein
LSCKQKVLSWFYCLYNIRKDCINLYIISHVRFSASEMSQCSVQRISITNTSFIWNSSRTLDYKWNMDKQSYQLTFFAFKFICFSISTGSSIFCSFCTIIKNDWLCFKENQHLLPYMLVHVVHVECIYTYQERFSRF